MSPGWWWDADIRTWVEVKRNLGEWPGWRWDRALIKVYHTSSDLGGGEMWPWLRWHMNIRTWMELRHCLEGGVMWLYGPGLGWDSTCMEVRVNYLDPDPDEIGPGWRWDTYLESLMGLWGCLYGAEMQFWGPAWRWDVTWMKMRHKHKYLDWGEKPHGWKGGVNQGTWGVGWGGGGGVGGGGGWGGGGGGGGWWDANLETWMKMRWDLDWVETHIFRSG